MIFAMIATSFRTIVPLKYKHSSTYISKSFYNKMNKNTMETTTTTTTLSALTDRPIDQEIKIKSCNNMDISRAANFLGQYWFDEETEMSRSQRQEFIRLENTDLTRRYGELVGRRNATLLAATESEDIIG